MNRSVDLSDRSKGMTKVMREKSYARLLKTIRQENELCVVDKPDLVVGGKAWRKREKLKKLAEEERVERDLARKRAQKKYYEKNKDYLNRKRALRNRQPEYVYRKAELKARRRGQKWALTFEEWIDIWMSAPQVYDEEIGFEVPAWHKKGPNSAECTQMMRRDLDKGWAYDNCYISYQGEEL